MQLEKYSAIWLLTKFITITIVNFLGTLEEGFRSLIVLRRKLQARFHRGAKFFVLISIHPREVKKSRIIFTPHLHMLLQGSTSKCAIRLWLDELVDPLLSKRKYNVSARDIYDIGGLGIYLVDHNLRPSAHFAMSRGSETGKFKLQLATASRPFLTGRPRHLEI